MAEKPITDIGKVFKDKDGAYRIYVGKQIANAAHFENKEKVRLDLSVLSLNLSEMPVRTLVNSLLFIYRQTAFAKLGIKTYFSEKCSTLVDPQNIISLNQTINKIEYLLTTLRDTEFYLNKRLFLHSILARCLFEG
jgi:hypothetical protein